MSALIWCLFADEDSAAIAARQLLEERLIACANIMGPLRSIYTWQGETHETPEIGVLFKTDAALLDQAVERIAELHPYEAPAVMGWRTDTVADETARWLGELTNGG